MKVRSLLLACLILLPSILILSRASFSYFPEKNSRVITVEIELKGSYQEGVEQVITNPLEEELSLLEGLKSISSVSEDEKARITLVFHNQVNLDRAYLEVSDRIDRISASFPSHAGKPRLMRSDSGSFPVFILMLKKESLSESRESLEKRIQSLPGVGKVEIGGMENRDVILKTDSSRLGHYRLGIDDIASLISRNNRIVSVPVRPGLSLTSDLRYASLEDYSRQSFSAGLFLDQLILPYMEDAPRQTIARVNGRDSILVWIHMAGDGNAIRLCRSLVSFQATLPESRILYNKGEVIEKALWKTARAVLIGIAAVFIVTGLFLRKGKIAGLISANIPFSLVIAMAILTWRGKEIDLMVLSGFCVATGLIIDAGVILVECGRKEARQPIFYSILSTILVFTVFLFAPGPVQELYQGMIGSITLVLLISCAYLFSISGDVDLKSRTQSEQRHDERYASLWNLLRRLRWGSLIVLGITAGLCGYGASILSFRSELLPNDGNMTFFYEYPSGTPRDSVLIDLEDLEETMTSWEEVRYFSSEFKPEKAVFRLRLASDTDTIRQTLIDRISGLSRGVGGTLFFDRAEDNRTYDVTILAHNKEILFRQAREAADILQAHLPEIKVIMHFKERPPLIRLLTDKDISESSGPAPVSLYRQISQFLNRPVRLKWLPVKPIVPGQYSYDVRFLKGDYQTLNREELMDFPVETNHSETRKLIELIREESVPDYGRIYHFQGRRGVQLSLEFQEGRKGNISTEVETLLSGLDWKEGVKVIHGKDFTERNREIRILALCVVLAVILVFLLLLYVFESAVIPVFLILQIPGALLFPLGLLALFRIPLSSPVLFSMILIIGISVNNGIVLFSGMEKGKRNRDSLLLALQTRSVSLIAALVTTVAGIVPLLFTTEGLNDPFGALSFTIGAGLLYSLVSLYLTLPLLEKEKGKKKARKSGR